MITGIDLRIRKIRKHLKLNQKELAKKLNTLNTTISKYEQGVNSPSVDFLFVLHEKLNVNLNWLISGKGDMFNKV